MKPRTRAQRAMMAKPSRKATAAALAAFAPPDWQPPVREKRRRKLVEDGLDGIGGTDVGKLPEDGD